MAQKGPWHLTTHSPKQRIYESARRIVYKDPCFFELIYKSIASGKGSQLFPKKTAPISFFQIAGFLRRVAHHGHPRCRGRRHGRSNRFPWIQRGAQCTQLSLVMAAWNQGSQERRASCFSWRPQKTLQHTSTNQRKPHS